MKTFWRVILCLSMMAPQGAVRLQMLCYTLVEVEGAEPVVVLYASISVLNLMRAATGSQCREIKRGVTWALLGSLKTSRAAAF